VLRLAIEHVGADESSVGADIRGGGGQIGRVCAEAARVEACFGGVEP
jgi:hypothetical protein